MERAKCLISSPRFGCCALVAAETTLISKPLVGVISLFGNMVWEAGEGSDQTRPGQDVQT